MRVERTASELIVQYPDPPVLLVEAAPHGWNLYGTQGGVTVLVGHYWTRRGAERSKRRVAKGYERWVNRVMGGTHE